LASFFHFCFHSFLFELDSTLFEPLICADSQFSQLQQLRELGFHVDDHASVHEVNFSPVANEDLDSNSEFKSEESNSTLTSIQSLLDKVNNVQEQREQLLFDIDGVVFKVSVNEC
jgi:NAD-dependent DNA ligase